jgi:DNA-binding NtrC family response regulator
VGGSGYQPFDARIVAATRCDLVRAVNDGAFRSDLYFRVAQVRLEVPPLRARLDDLAGLIERFGGERGAAGRVSPQGMARLHRYDWPGNVRELKNAVLAALALSDKSGPLDVSFYLDGAPSAAEPPQPMPRDVTYHDAKRDALDRFERAYFAALAATCDGNIAEISRRAGLQRTHVRRYMKAHGLLLERRRRGP